MSRVIIIEVDAESREVGAMFSTDTCDQLLWCKPFLLGFEHDRRAMGVIRTHIVAFMPTEFLKPHPDIGLDVLDQVPDMDGAVRVRQRAGDEDATRRSVHAGPISIIGLR